MRSVDGVLIDPSGKVNGRGAYVHANQDCLGRAMKGGLEQALRTNLGDEDRSRIEEAMQSLPHELKQPELAKSGSKNQGNLKGEGA